MGKCFAQEPGCYYDIVLARDAPKDELVTIQTYGKAPPVWVGLHYEITYQKGPTIISAQVISVHILPVQE